MFHRFRKILITAASISLVVSPLAIPAMAHAASATINNTITANACYGVDSVSNNNPIDLSQSATTGANDDCTSDTSANTGIGGLLNTVVNILSIIVGAIAVIMIIIGGFKYITSGGSDQGVAGAKNTIIYALVGLVIVALAQVMVHFVLNKLSTT